MEKESNEMATKNLQEKPALTAFVYSWHLLGGETNAEGDTNWLSSIKLI